MTVTRPVMRYHGGKWMLAPWVVSHFPPHLRYVEPYCGAGSVLLRKPRVSSEVLNDRDDEVVNLFRVLRDPEQAGELARLVRLTPWSRAEFQAAYEEADSPVERARRLLVRAYMARGSVGAARVARAGFRGSGWRKEHRNNPATMDWLNYPKAIPAFVERLMGVIIENRPALRVMEIYDTAETLTYCDPPYVHSTRTSIATNGTAYRYEMADADHRELAELVHRMKGMVIISGYDCELYRELYADWRMVSRKARADLGLERTECLWISPSASKALPQRSLLEAHA